MLLTLVVPEVGKLTAGVFDVMEYHDTLALVGTVKLVAVRPSVW